ncbi:MAG: 16S rRNA (adenine(1518)-N(6)/adenine(1519)-N(6))-dimethyltransferase RsmA [Acidimicrobiaceae bacterium]|nr:16S rRNA (adenine(1518)-N(6)/adenine(1519)-N(6))-dimethyltransferase RsmA [Acidimicrobiaceae bacterium]
MERFCVSPRRSFGQNFVADPNTVRRIARLSGAGPADRVLEIGAGLGSLTLALAETGAAVRAVEVDSGLAAALREVVAEAGARRVEVVEGDAAALDLDDVLEGSDRWMLVANLPYNIATGLVVDLLHDAAAISVMVVMVQREVGERLTAPPGSRARGVPSVLVEQQGAARVVAKVPASVFRPRPKVESVVVRIERHRSADALPMPPEADARFDLLVRTGFGQRRKMLRRSLAGLVGADGFAAAGVDPAARPEALSVDQWIRLARTGL